MLPTIFLLDAKKLKKKLAVMQRLYITWRFGLRPLAGGGLQYSGYRTLLFFNLWLKLKTQGICFSHLFENFINKSHRGLFGDREAPTKDGVSVKVKVKLTSFIVVTLILYSFRLGVSFSMCSWRCDYLLTGSLTG